ncbi:hypothetical protein [Acidiferrobacter sp.]|uniref:phosphorylase family protein n=1 Tax=Acidiferrobacter sp. TaxID=1872107 RepID=UPI002618B5E5|nr:hypothetical protein [Acidiferrobacter sp.]
MLSQPGHPLDTRYGVVVALAAEARVFGRGIPLGHPWPLANGHWLGVSGMGPKRARHMAVDLVARDVQGLVSFGTCAGLAPGLAAGALICPRTVCDEQGTVYHASSLAAFGCAQVACVSTERLISVAQPVNDARGKADLLRRTGAWAADMESAALARVAAEHGLAFLVVRVVVDAFDAPVPARLMEGLDAWGRPRAGALVVALGADVRQWRALARLGRDFAKARQTLADAAVALTRGSLAGGHAARARLRDDD